VCLLVLAVGHHPIHPIILAGNRDEFYSRASSEAHWWSDKPDILGGRDLEAGGTWLALHRNGRFATVTNYREAQARSSGLRSRGELVTGFLDSTLSPLDYLESIDSDRYAGFNLIAGDTRVAAYASNRGNAPRELAPGVYGLSNASLDTPWEKVVRSKGAFSRLLQNPRIGHTELLEMLDDRRTGAIDPQPGQPDAAMARALTAPFIVTPRYGTRCSTVITSHRDGTWRLSERRFDEHGDATGQSQFSVRNDE
jgi:uncharacterized protein with NRDE domain